MRHLFNSNFLYIFAETVAKNKNFVTTRSDVENEVKLWFKYAKLRKDWT